MTNSEFPAGMREDARVAWHRFIDFFVPFRPQLFQYCRRLTGDVWDAEDLVQEAMLHGFGILGRVNSVSNPRGYLTRIATNLWIDRVRRRSTVERVLERESTETSGEGRDVDAGEVRDAAKRLMESLSPQERAAIVLKEVFDMSLQEIAQVLMTSVGAIKAALHSGRRRLQEVQPPDSHPASRRRPAVSAKLVDKFVVSLNASDLKGLLDLMLDTASIDMVGTLLEVGRGEFEREGSWLWHAVNVHSDLPPELRPPKFINERAIYEGEPLNLGFLKVGEAKLLMAIQRFEEIDGRIARIRSYNFNPEVLQEVGSKLGFTVGQVPYRLHDGPAAKR